MNCARADCQAFLPPLGIAVDFMGSVGCKTEIISRTPAPENSTAAIIPASAFMFSRFTTTKGQD